MKILVLGGTRFFGRRAVEQLIKKGHDVTIATRGNTPHGFGEEVAHVTLDVEDPQHEGWHTIENQTWDAVFNNILYTKEDAELMLEKFTNKTDHFYFTSTMSVYSGDQAGYAEEDFDPVNYKIAPEKEVDYGEGKRQAEHILFTQAPFTVMAFRFPIVLDTDDYTRRLHYYIEKALKNEPIHFYKTETQVNFVKGSVAADAIVWAIENTKTGIYNISSADAVSVNTIMDWIGEATGKNLTVDYSGKEGSPFSAKHDQYIISDKIMSEGFSLMNLEEWLKPLINELTNELK